MGRVVGVGLSANPIMHCAHEEFRLPSLGKQRV